MGRANFQSRNILECDRLQLYTDILIIYTCTTFNVFASAFHW